MAFQSTANDLVPGDSGFTDIFVFDRATCAVERVSVSSSETPANSSSERPAITDDGRFVVFQSNANNLAPDSNGFTTDIFLRDRLLGTTTLVSLGFDDAQGSSSSTDAEVSGDGNFVVFVSGSATLVPNDTNNEADVFVRDLVNGTTDRVSISSTGAQGDSPQSTGVSEPALSFDGRHVAFASSMNTLVTDDFNNQADIFVRDRMMGTTVRASISSAGVEASQFASISSPAISGDGRYVAFEAGSNSNLVPGDTTCDGIFIRDLLLNTTSCLPLRPAGGFPSDDGSDPAISFDGRYVLFTSSAAYVPGDNGFSDTYVHDRAAVITRRVSVSAAGLPPNTSFGFDIVDISADGQFAAFGSGAGNLVPGDLNGMRDVFVSHWPMLPDQPHIDGVGNGSFTNAMQKWQTFATPDSSYIVTQLTSGVLEFYRQPPPAGTSNQAVVFQNTTSRFLAHEAIEARFDLGNSSSVRKRLTVLLHESDFTDLSVCTFWLPPNAPLRTYAMRAHTTKFWNNATVSFYAATTGSDGGFYRLDNVSLYSIPEQDDDRTDCVDPLAPVAPGGAAGPNLITNSGFDSGLPPWLTFGQIVFQIANGIFEFYRPAGTPSGVVFQQTGVALAQHDIITANFYLGNSSTVRKRVTVLLHDASFSDLSACTFWLPPGLPLAPYRMRTYATQAWTNATVSVFPATVGDDQWIQLDNVMLQATPAASTDGTNCLEPGADIMTALRRGARSMGQATTGSAAATRVPPMPVGRHEARVHSAVSQGVETLVVWQDAVELTQIGSGRLVFDSQLRTTGRSHAVVQVTVDGVSWQSVSAIPRSDDWLPIDVDLEPFTGRVVHIRIVLDARRADDGLFIRDPRIVTGQLTSNQK